MAFFDRMSVADRLSDVIHPIRETDDLMEPILNLVDKARIVMIGEASHGTHDFYDIRADITKRLIQERGFNVVCAEADWPDSWRVNRYVRGFNDDTSAAEALAGFKRFPQWMWRNTVVLDFVDWLRTENESRREDERRAGFYGIDLYGMNQSIRAVLGYLDRVDPEAAKRALPVLVLRTLRRRSAGVRLRGELQPGPELRGRSDRAAHRPAQARRRLRQARWTRRRG